jgi:hypothetical protein
MPKVEGGDVLIVGPDHVRETIAKALYRIYALDTGEIYYYAEWEDAVEEILTSLKSEKILVVELEEGPE